MIPLICHANNNNANWQNFENNVYIGAGFSANKASINQFGTVSTNSPFGDLGMTILLNNKIYANVELNGTFANGGSYVSNWMSGAIKFGYSLQAGSFNFIPYVIGGYGNQGAYYSSANNASYGGGLLSEYMITPSWLLYVDANYQWQSFGSGINNDFNKNVLNNYATYQLSGNPGNLGIGAGIKYITPKGFYFNPFFKYENYSQSFTQNGGVINYGTLSPATNQFQVGVNIGLGI